MASVSHRDPDGVLPDGVTHILGRGSPEGVIEAPIGSLFRRLDGTPGETLYVKESGGDTSAGWQAIADSAVNVTVLTARVTTAEGEIDALQAADTALDARVGALETADTTQDSRLTAVEGDVTALEAADVALAGRLDTVEGDIAGLATVATTGAAADLSGLATVATTGAASDLTGLATVATSGLASDVTGLATVATSGAAADVSGLATVATSGSAADLTGTLAAGRLPALSGDISTSAGSAVTAIGNDKVLTTHILDKNVTLAKLADMNTASFLGRTTGGSGVPEVLTATQATAMLNLATSTLKGLSPAFPNNTTTFLRGDGSYATPKKKAFMTFGASSRTANVSARYLNPSGSAASPAGTGIAYDVVPVTGDVVAVIYYVGTIPSTSMTLTPRISGSEAAGAVTVLNGGATVARVAISPIAVTAGTSVLVPRLDQVGTGGTDRISVCYEIEYE